MSSCSWVAARRRLAGRDAFQHDGGCLAGSQLDLRTNAATVDDLERTACREADVQFGRAEQRTVRQARDRVMGARVVEARGDVDDEAHLPTNRDHPADQAARM